jgi:hypothetical protein
LYEQLLQVPITSNHLPFLLFWIIGPYVLEREHGNSDRAKEVLKQYLTRVNQIRPLKPNPTWWTRLLEQIITVAQNYKEAEGYDLRPMPLSKLKEMDETLFKNIMASLAAAAPPASAVD